MSAPKIEMYTKWGCPYCVAAKGLLRYPELQRSGRDSGPTDVSEYFLIGSFASWLLALGGWVLVLLLG